MAETVLTSSHWGLGLARTHDGKLLRVDPHPDDPAPSALNGNIAESLNGRARIRRPAVRASWLAGVPGERGRDPFVEVSWDEALDLITQNLDHVRQRHGNSAIFAGSYGWASAGRFHHAQSQLKRFLNTIGGFTASTGNYSYNAALVAMPHIVGGSFRDHIAEATRWSVIARHSDLVVLFGGMAQRNTQVCDGGNTKHRLADQMRDCVKNGVRFVNISPLRRDLTDAPDAEWIAPLPGTDTALMMGLAHTLIDEDLHDVQFLERYTTGFGKVAAYLTGEADGTVRDADWAAEISGIPAGRIRALARDMAAGRTMIGCAASLQRADHGEQPLWMTVTLAALLGQIGLPGGGYTIGYGVNGHIGCIARPFRWAHLPQGDNPVTGTVPVAMLTEMLERPGETYRFNGETRTFPDIKMIWWAGGNPFHHHQDLNRLRRAFQRPQTIVVNEISWTATARHADIVLPVSSPLERSDFGGGRSDNCLVPMPAAATPPDDARHEYDIYADLANRLGTQEAFTEGRDTEGWLRHLWSETCNTARQSGLTLPDWDDFIRGGIVELPDPDPDQVFLSSFREDPDHNPRPTPDGRIRLYSDTVAGFGLEHCPGHAAWIAPRDASSPAAAEYPLAMLSGQPATRLHSQQDDGPVSRAHKTAGRETMLIHPDDAARRGIRQGDLVEIFNARGRCVAGASLTDDIRSGTVFLWTGAWYDPDFEHPHHRDRHGNPNVLTHDLRTSEFSQGPASHSARVDVRKLTGDPGPVRAHEPPAFVDRSDISAQETGGNAAR